MRRVLVIAVLVSMALSGAVGQAQSNLQRLSSTLTRAGQLEQQGKLDEAMTAYQASLDLARQVYGRNHTNCAAILKSLGDVSRQAGRYSEAEPFLKDGIAICQTSGDRALAMELRASLASSYVERGDYQNALSETREVLALSESLSGKSSSQTAKILGNLGGVYRGLGQDDEAEKLYGDSIALLERMPSESATLASTLMNVANIYTDRGEFVRAESTMTRALNLAERSFGRTSQQAAFLRNNLAVLYQGIGLWEKAEQMHREVLALLVNLLGPEHPYVATSYNNLAIVLDRQGKFVDAETNYRKGLAVRQARLGKDHPSTLISLQALGTFLAAQNRFEEADAVLTEGLQLRKQKLGETHPEVAHSLSSIGFLRYRQGRFDDAREFHRQELAINLQALPPPHPRTSGTYAAMGATESAVKDWPAATTAFDASRRIARRYVGSVLPGLSEPEQLTFLKTTDQPQFHRAIALAVESPDEAVVNATAEWVVNGKGVAQQALAQRALLMRDAADQAVAVLAKQVRDLRKLLATTLHAGDGNQRQQQAEIEALTRQEEESSRKLAEKTGRSAAVAEWVSLEDLRKRIPADAVVVEIVRFDRYDHRSEEPLADAARYGAWVIPTAGELAVQFVDLGLASEIDQASSEARKELQESTSRLQEVGEAEAEAALKPVLERLSKLVLRPVLERVGGQTTIYLSPDSQLWIVPWSALTLESGAYAVETLDIRYLVSSRDLIAGPVAAGSGGAVMMADPNYDLDPAGVKAAVQSLLGKRPASTGAALQTSGTSRLGVAERLPGTRLEAMAIEPSVKQMMGSDPQLWVDRFALEHAFKAIRQPRLLVLCTHGFFQPEMDGGEGRQQPATAATPRLVNPLVRCGLLLAGCNQPDRSSLDSEDGILTGIEIVETDLRGTELVVLSACETGLGEIKNGQGVSGLRQAFQLAGARSVISTLWKIPDVPSARLMRDFFVNLAAGDDQARALRGAQLKQIESRRERYGAAHPFFWAAFTLTGA